MPSIQIIIPVVNLWSKYTKPCIDSVVKACEGFDYRILLIDNGSTDETSVEAGKLVSHHFSHKRNDVNWGCAKSWNYGVKDAFRREADYAFVINNDVLFHPKAIQNVLFRLKFDKDVLSILPKNKIVPNNRKDIPLAMATCMNVAEECLTPDSIFKLDFKKEDVKETENPDFSAFMITKEGYEKVGEFDENFSPAYFEDNDYHYRINLAGLKAITVPMAVYYHYGSRTSVEGLPRSIERHQSFERNRQYYIKKWGGMPGKENYKTPFNK